MILSADMTPNVSVLDAVLIASVSPVFFPPHPVRGLTGHFTSHDYSEILPDQWPDAQIHHLPYSPRPPDPCMASTLRPRRQTRQGDSDSDATHTWSDKRLCATWSSYGLVTFPYQCPHDECTHSGSSHNYCTQSLV